MSGLAARIGRVFGFGGTWPSGGGNRFAVRASAGAGVPEPAYADAAVAHAMRRSGLTALVADDSTINCTILRTFLERLGFHVVSAEDGAEALDRWVPGEFDLICLDIEMPRLDGLTAFRAMKSETERSGAEMPLALAVTINAMSQEVTGYLQAGFDACLPKPFSRTDLVQLLRQRWPQLAA